MYKEDNEPEFSPERTLGRLRATLWIVIVFMSLVGSICLAYINRFNEFSDLFWCSFGGLIFFFGVGVTAVFVVSSIVFHFDTKRRSVKKKELSEGYWFFIALLVAAAVSALVALFFFLIY